MNYQKHKNILIEKYKSIFYVIPKNGCSSMQAKIVELLGLEKGSDFPNDIHEPTIYPYPYVKKEELNGQYSDYLRYCFVRNPWDRIVSCFKDKIKPAEFNNEEYIKGVARPLHYCSPLFFGGMSFEDFVNVVFSIPDARAEHHFSSQLFQITDSTGNLLVNYIGQFERLSEDLKDITHKTGIPLIHFPHLRKTKRKSYQEYYSEELVEKVSIRFSADIEFFGYTFNGSNILLPLGVVDEKMKEKLSTPAIIDYILEQKMMK